MWGTGADATAVPAGSPFLDADTPDVAIGQTSPPTGLILAAAAAGAMAALTALLADRLLWPACVAWALAGPLAFGLLARYTARDTALRAGPLYSSQPWVRLAFRGAVLVALLGLVAAAARIADHVARL